MSNNHTQCQVCTARTNAFLCKTCTRELEQAIAELPADIADLTAVATRQALGPLGLGDNSHGRLWDEPAANGALGDAPWMFAPGAADQLWALQNTVTTWARHLAELRGAELPKPPNVWLTVPDRRLSIRRNRACWIATERRVEQPAKGAEVSIKTVAQWLLTHVESIRFDEAAGQIYEELTGLHDENVRWSIGTRGVETFAGRCDATQVSFELDGDTLIPVAATCGAGLYGHEGEAEVRCKACGTRYRLADRLAAIREREINDQLARAHAIADALTDMDEPLSPTLLRKWIQRDAIRGPAPHGPACVECGHRTCLHIRRCPIIAQGFDDDGHPLYRVGDVRARLQLVQAQRGIRLSV